MSTVEIYTTPICGYCRAAKRLLDEKNVAYKEIDVMSSKANREEMTRRAQGGTSVPQIFFGEVHVGGSDELHALERAGKLDALLAA